MTSQTVTSFAWGRIALRTVAILIAIAAAIDPSFSSVRGTRPVVSVVSGDETRDSARIATVERALQSSFTVVRAPLASAAGTVVVGTLLPRAAASLASPVVVLPASTRAPSVRLQRVMAPTRAMSNARVPVSAALTVTTARPTSASTTTKQSTPTPVRVHVELLLNESVVARSEFTVSRDTTRTVQLDMVPTRARPTLLQLRAFVDGARDTVHHDMLVDVRDARWSILFFDRRPSWMSTFVRRALTRDPRFAVTSRIVTSTNVSRETGRPPAGLDELANISRFDAVVIGAPDALTARDADGVNTLLRARGASVMVLADHLAASPLDGLLAIGGWTTTTRRTAASIVAASSSTTAVDNVAAVSVASDAMHLKALSIGVPRQLPPSAQLLGVVHDMPNAPSPVIWRVPVGVGQLYVSGAFDAWRFRDSAQSTFDATWRDLVDQAASAHQSTLDLRLESTLVGPGEMLSAVLTPRDSIRATVQAGALTAVVLALGNGTDSVSARTVSTVSFSRITSTASLSATFLSPQAPGSYELVATIGLDTARQSFVVKPLLAHDGDDAPQLALAWAQSRGGRALSQDHADSLSAVLLALIQPANRMTTWHPMRSPWWIVPFALALAAEWWSRRRRGLP